MVGRDQFLEGNGACSWEEGVAKEVHVDENVVDQRVSARGAPVGGGTFRDEGHQFVGVEPLFEGWCPCGEREVRRGPSCGVGVKVAAEQERGVRNGKGEEVAQIGAFVDDMVIEVNNKDRGICVESDA